MKIVALNGSPKNNYSITRQHVEYLKKVYPQINFTIISIGHQIIKLERNKQLFDEVIKQINESDAVLWISPIYIAHLPAQILRFFELIWERKANHAFKGKYCASISTSIHFFDQLAHQYLKEASLRLDMKFIDYFSASIRGLLNTKERQKFNSFANFVINTIKSKNPVLNYQIDQTPLNEPNDNFSVANNNNDPILVLSDNEPEIKDKVKIFIESFEKSPNLINITTLDIQRGCLGCLRCGYDCKCKSENSAQLYQLFNGTIKQAKTIIFACTIKHGFISSKWKNILDCLFFNNHLPYLQNKKVAFIFSQPSSRHIQKFIQSYCNVYQGHLLGHTTNQLSTLANIITQQQDIPARIPQDFETIAAQKILRDAFLSGALKIYRQDFLYFKKAGFFKRPPLRPYLYLRLIIFLLRFPFFQQKIGNNIYKALCSPHKKFLAKDQI